MSTANIRTALTAIQNQLSIIEAQCDAIDGQNPIEPSIGINCLGGIEPTWGTSNLITGEIGEVDFVSRRPQIRTDMTSAPDGSICVVGDSLMYQLNMMNIAPNAVNMAIPGQSTRQLIYMMKDMDSNNQPNLLKRAGAGVMMIGINDGRDTYYSSVQDALVTVGGWTLDLIQKWQTGKWVICKLLQTNQVSPSYVNGMNAYIDQYYGNRTGFVIVDTSILCTHNGLKPEYDSGDGLHLNAAGKLVLEGLIRTAIESLSEEPHTAS